jgi:DNA polymerase III alpha subunit
LFEGHDVNEPAVKLPELRPAQQLLLDYDRKGLSVSDHPMNHLRARLKSKGIVRAADLEYLSQGTAVRVAGLVLSRQQPGTASGVVFITLEDETGFVNLIVYRHVFEQLRMVARHASLLLASGTVEREPNLPPKSRVEESATAPTLPSAELSRELSAMSADASSRARSSAVSAQVAASTGPPRTPVIHVVVKDLERLDVPGSSPKSISRDFH